MKLSLRPVCRKDYKFLYELLRQRKLIECISHHVMPTYEEHCKFHDSKPFKASCIILDGQKPIGLYYISKKDEVAVHFIETIPIEVKKSFIFDHKKEMKYMNVAPNNLVLQNILETFGFRPIQITYENILSRF